MMCPLCGERTKVLTTRNPSTPGNGWEVSRVSPSIDWYTEDFVVRRRKCKSCSEEFFTVELVADDMIQMMKGAVDGHAPNNLIKSSR